MLHWQQGQCMLHSQQEKVAKISLALGALGTWHQTKKLGRDTASYGQRSAHSLLPGSSCGASSCIDLPWPRLLSPAVPPMG